MTDIPHFTQPFRFQLKESTRARPQPLIGQSSPVFWAGQIVEAVTTEQDDDREITDCIETILRYPVGFRQDKPEFGTPDQLFRTGGASTEEIRSAIREWEPRVDAVVSDDPGVLENMMSQITIGLRRRGDEGV